MNDEKELLELHDQAAKYAQGWRRLQGFLEEGRNELIPAAPHPERDDAIAEYESLMTFLRTQEMGERETMMSLRKQIGREPPRRTKKAAGK